MDLETRILPWTIVLFFGRFAMHAERGLRDPPLVATYPRDFLEVFEVKFLGRDGSCRTGIACLGAYNLSGPVFVLGDSRCATPGSEECSFLFHQSFLLEAVPLPH